MTVQANQMIGKFVGDYQITGPLGEGGMGIVFKGVHPTLQQIVAIKMLHPNLVKTAGIKERFVREAQAMARLRHQNILQLYNFVENDSGCFIIMEFVEGQTFEDLLEQQGLVPPDRSIDMFLPILKGIGFAHSQNIIHRDIKPANLMILNDGVCKVMDFGTAKVTDASALTAAGMTLGTVVYMSPEQLMGRDLSPQADIYSLGVTLYEMVTGQLPFYDENEMTLMKMIMKQQPAPPSQHYPALPKSLEAIIMKSMSKERSQRYASCQEFTAVLTQVKAELSGAGSGAIAVGTGSGAHAMPGQPHPSGPAVNAPGGGSSGAVAAPPGELEATQTVQRQAVGGTVVRPAGGGGIGGMGIAGIVLAVVGFALLIGLIVAGYAIPGAIAGSVLILAGVGLLVGGMMSGKAQPAGTVGAPMPPQAPLAPAGPAAAPSRSLEFIDGPLRGRRQELTEAPITIGRAPDNTLCLQDPSVSSHHARIDFFQGKYFVSDQRSSNGTYVNNQRIDQAQLNTNDILAFGASRVVVRL